MGKFTLAPFYIDDYSGFDKKQKNSINSLLKSFYNRLQSKSVQRTVSSNTASVHITKQNNTIRLARVSCSRDVIHCYFEFYIGHLQPNARETFVVLDQMPFEDYYIIPSGYVDDTLALPIHNFASFTLEDTSLIIERTEWNAEYQDPYEMYFENKGLDNLARITVDIIKKKSKEEEEDKDDVTRNNQSFISHGEIQQKIALNTAINTLYNYIDSYKADVTKQDYIESSDNPGVKYATKPILGIVGDYILDIGNIDASGHLVSNMQQVTIPTNSYRYGKTLLDGIASYQDLYNDHDKDLGTEERVTQYDNYSITETVHKYMRYEGWQIGNRAYNFSCPFERIEKVVITTNEIIPIGKIPSS